MSQRASMTVLAKDGMHVFHKMDEDKSGTVEESEFVDFFLGTEDDLCLSWMQQALVNLLGTWKEEGKRRMREVGKKGSLGDRGGSRAQGARRSDPRTGNRNQG